MDSGSEFQPAVVCQQSYVPGAKSSKEKPLPSPPKRPVNSYLLFSAKIFPQVKQQNPEYKGVDIVRTIGTMWKSMPEEEKKNYEKLYKQDSADYIVKKMAYIDSLSPEQKEALKENAKKKKQKRTRRQMRKISREFDKPKKAPTGYILFSNKQMANREGEFKEQKDLVKKIGEEWKALAPEDKEMYNEAAMDLAERYQKDLQAWEERMIDEGHPELVRGYKKPSKSKKKAAKSEE